MEAEKPKSAMAKREEEILKFWQENKIFEKSLAKPAPKGDFVFYEGPPTANGRPGIHHLVSRAFKDLIPRFKTMQGYHVRRKAGWDTHGLPVELEVEKTLNLKSKKEIEQYGLAEFNAECRKNVWKYLTEWQQFTERMGFWLDQNDQYVTYDIKYIESVWWALKQAADKNLLYQDYKVVPWCPRCGTALSSHELAQGYATVVDPAVYVKFKVKNPEKHNLPASTFLLAWTTTPWTLPGNVALAIGEKINYVLQQAGDDYLIVARKLANLAPSSGNSPIAAAQLISLEYEPLYDFPQLQNNKSHRVYAADFVNTEEGTGIVHTAVMYGQDDFELGVKIGLPKYHLVATDGTFIAGTPWSGKFVKDVDQEIIADLEQRGLLFKREQIEHEYPFCWRCKTPLIYYARDSWYVRMSALKEILLAENQKINWIPPHIRDGRFGEWLAEVKDWAISRERYWGTPLPIWLSADKTEILVIGSLEELKTHTKKSNNQYFIMRHGEAEHNILGINNSGDPELYPLTKLGRDQVAAAARNLKPKKITRICSSPFRRTRESAEIMAKELGLNNDQIIVDDRLRELNFGDFDGKLFSEFLEYQSKQISSYADKIPGGESYLDAKRRFGNLLYESETILANENILIITHGVGPEVLAAVVAGANQIEAKQITDNLKVSFASPSALDFIPLSHNADYELDLHRPFIDDLVLLGDSGQPLRRATEVLDVWFDSGAMPFAEDHYPFATKKILYPADFIAEAIDQTRGWFYTLLAIGVLLDRGAPYKNAICLGHILDQTGKKMSKSIGNTIGPWLMMDKYGVDVLRFWMYTVNQPGDSKNFDEVSVNEVAKKIVNPLANVISFYNLYADKNSPAKISAPPHLLDRWVLALFNELTTGVTHHLEHYEITEAARAIKDFISDLSQWYIRRSRDRFRGNNLLERKEASAALGFVLVELAKLLAPFTPFLAEDIYQKISLANKLLSVHLTDWPVPKKLKTKKLLADMAEVRRIASLALEARARAGLKIRQPLAKLSVRASDRGLKEFALLLADEVNVKDVIWSKDLTGEIELDTTLTPELKKEGQVRDLVRQIQDLRKQSDLRPGQSAILIVSTKHPSCDLIEQQTEKLQQATGLSRIEFSDTADVPLSVSH